MTVDQNTKEDSKALGIKAKNGTSGVKVSHLGSLKMAFMALGTTVGWQERSTELIASSKFSSSPDRIPDLMLALSWFFSAYVPGILPSC